MGSVLHWIVIVSKSHPMVPQTSPPALTPIPGPDDHVHHDDLVHQVWSVVEELGLSRVAHCFIGDSFVRGLSGGEKRRVSIGCELLTRPGLLLLDEPTTGLDSTNAARVVDILSSLSGQQGVTVLLSIHQPRPDIFRLMDRVLLLSGEGQVGVRGNRPRSKFRSRCRSRLVHRPKLRPGPRTKARDHH